MQMLWFLPSLAFGIYLGFSSGMWQMAIMSGFTAVILVVTILRRGKAKKIDLTAEVWLSASGIAIGNHILPKRSIYWRAEWNELVWAKSEREQAAQAASSQLLELQTRGLAAAGQGSLTATLGFAISGNLEVDLVDSGPHLLITGPTGVGKSQFLRFLLRSLRSKYSPAELQIALVDFKGGSTLGSFSSESGVWAFVTDLDAASQQTELWDRIDEELQQREALFALTGTADIDGYRAVATKLPRLVVVIDELGAALSGSNRPLSTVEAVAARGRSLGVHLICASQSLAGIPRSLVTNLRLRCAIGAVDQIEIAQLGGTMTRATNLATSRPNWGFGQLIAANEPTQWFEFPFGLALDAPQDSAKPAESRVMPMALSEPEPPARLRVRQRGYSSRALMLRLLDKLLANQGSLVRERMASLRL